MQWPIRPLYRWTLFGFILVCAGHITSVVTTYGLPPFEKGTYLIHDLFFFEHEKSLSSLFTATLFIVLGAYFKTIGSHLNNQVSKWQFLSVVAFFLACDEWFAIHDAALNIYGMGLFGIPVWLWVYGTLAIVLLITYIPFLLRIPPFLKKALLLSGLLYISGSGIMEVVTYTYNGHQSVANHVAWFFEDSLEMMGILTMIGAATYWLRQQQCPVLKVSKRATFLIFGVGILDFLVYFFLYIW